MRATTRSHNGGQARNPATGETFSFLFRSRAERLIRLCGDGAPFWPLPCSPLPPRRDWYRGPSYHHRQRNTPLPNQCSIENIRKSVKSKDLHLLWITAKDCRHQRAFRRVRGFGGNYQFFNRIETPSGRPDFISSAMLLCFGTCVLFFPY